jgi:hypothetical protein
MKEREREYKNMREREDEKEEGKNEELLLEWMGSNNNNR